MFREGQQIGVYTLVGRLGKGGFGEVWLAEKRSQFIVKRVAVKLPHEEQVNFDAIRQEAQLWEAASGHPNVLPIIDADVYDGQVCIVSEYADGGSLHDRLKRETKLDLKESVEMAIGILNGLEFLHSRKIIHRDIKPQNILLQGNTPRLADFGISRAMNTTMISSTIIGTDAYMSPESFDGKRNVQTDIWSVGVVLYQLLKGTLPFPQEHPTERMFAVLTKDFEPLSDEIPSDLRRIIDKSLAKLPENRFQTCAEMRDELSKAHVPLAHPTLAKTEVLRFPVEEKSIGESANTQGANEAEKETVVKDIPKPLYAPAPTLQAVASNSVATQVGQIYESANNPPVINPQIQAPNAPPIKKTRSLLKLFATLITTAIGGIILFAVIFGIYTISNEGLKEFKDSTGKRGFKDWKGKVVIEPKYDFVYPFGEGLAAVELNNKFGFIDESGKEVIPFKFDNGSIFFHGLADIKMNGKVGYIDKNGNTVIPFKYDGGENFFKDYSWVKLNGKYGYIDKTGVEVIAPKYDYFDKTFDGTYAVMIQNGRKLRVDRYGNETDIGAANNANVSNVNLPSNSYNSKPANNAANSYSSNTSH